MILHLILKWLVNFVKTAFYWLQWNNMQWNNIAINWLAIKQSIKIVESINMLWKDVLWNDLLWNDDLPNNYTKILLTFSKLLMIYFKIRFLIIGDCTYQVNLSHDIQIEITKSIIISIISIYIFENNRAIMTWSFIPDFVLARAIMPPL